MIRPALPVVFSRRAAEQIEEAALWWTENRLDIKAATLAADCIEDYPEDPRGPSCLVRCDIRGSPVHALWGFDESRLRAILITVYRPDPDRWSNDFRTRRRGSAG